MAEIINIEDIELAKLCARGDEKARHELYTRYAAYLFALDGGWYHVIVPDKGKSNTVIITVDPLSGDGNPREAIIEMQAGDAFTKISIAQQ